MSPLVVVGALAVLIAVAALAFLFGTSIATGRVADVERDNVRLRAENDHLRSELVATGQWVRIPTAPSWSPLTDRLHQVFTGDPEPLGDHMAAANEAAARFASAYHDRPHAAVLSDGERESWRLIVEAVDGVSCPSCRDTRVRWDHTATLPAPASPTEACPDCEGGR